MNSSPDAGRRRRHAAWAAAAVAAAVAATLIVVAVTGGSAKRTVKAGQPLIASVQDLRSFQKSAGHPVYWAGELDDTKLELTETSDGRVYVRYLADGVQVGDKRPNYVTVGTYPARNAYQQLPRASKAVVRRQAPGRATAVWYRARPTSIYLASPGATHLVEVFAPTAAQAQALVFDGAVGPVR